MDDAAPADSDRHERIMEAVRDALCSHGPADLTMQDIADEAGLSTAALHYHYDTKQALITSFLEYLEGEVAKWLASHADSPARDRVSVVLEELLQPRDPAEERLFTALAILRTQAPHVPAYREALVSIQTTIRSFVVEAIEEGVVAGVYDIDDPEAAARLLLAATRGARDGRVLLGDETETAKVGEALSTHVFTSLEGEEE
jgi:AcrR family transcriptional regulator